MKSVGKEIWYIWEEVFEEMWAEVFERDVNNEMYILGEFVWEPLQRRLWTRMSEVSLE